MAHTTYPAPAEGEVWASLSPKPFKEDELTYWSDGKPFCREHRRVLIPAQGGGSVSSFTYPTDGGTHLCASCMREQIQA